VSALVAHNVVVTSTSPDSPVPAEAVDPAAPDDAEARERAALEAQRQERAERRMRQTVRDMLLSMLVVGAVVVLLVAPWNWGSGSDPVKVVDPTSVITGSRASFDWPVLAPVGLPPTWRCTSARVDLAADGESIVHLGYLSPSTTYVGLEQSPTKMLTFVRDQTVSGVANGSVTIRGETWDRYESPDGAHRSLVRTADGVTYVVSGQADWPEIEAFTASLRAG
jgi:hypothetical protein